QRCIARNLRSGTPITRARSWSTCTDCKPPPRTTPWAATGGAFPTRLQCHNFLPAALLTTLYGRARYVAVRTEHATITSLGAQHYAATRAFVEEHASVFGHGFHAAMPAIRARERASKNRGFRGCRLGRSHGVMLRPGTTQNHTRPPATNCRSSVPARDSVQHRRTTAGIGSGAGLPRAVPHQWLYACQSNKRSDLHQTCHQVTHDSMRHKDLAPSHFIHELPPRLPRRQLRGRVQTRDPAGAAGRADGKGQAAVLLRHARGTRALRAGRSRSRQDRRMARRHRTTVRWPRVAAAAPLSRRDPRVQSRRHAAHVSRLTIACRTNVACERPACPLRDAGRRSCCAARAVPRGSTRARAPA